LWPLGYGPCNLAAVTTCRRGAAGHGHQSPSGASPGTYCMIATTQRRPPPGRTRTTGNSNGGGYKPSPFLCPLNGQPAPGPSTSHGPAVTPAPEPRPRHSTSTTTTGATTRARVCAPLLQPQHKPQRHPPAGAMLLLHPARVCTPVVCTPN